MFLDENPHWKHATVVVTSYPMTLGHLFHVPPHRGILLDSKETLLTSVKKSVVVTIVVLAIIAVAAYGLFALGGGNGRGGDETGFRSLNVRTLVTLGVVGGSAFITGFGLRDVIGRVMATRQRNRLKSMQEQKRP